MEEVLKLIIALVMFLCRKKFVVFMLKDIEPMGTRITRENGKVKFRLRLRGFDIIHLCLVGCINGFYYIAIMNLIWHNVGATMIAFLLGCENTRLAFLQVIFQKTEQTSSEKQEQNTDKFY